MSYEERPAKRMRVNNAGNHESEITEDEVFYSLAFQSEIAENDVLYSPVFESEITKNEVFYSPTVESSNALGTVEREACECCYGMVNKF